MASADQLITSLQGLDASSFASEAERIRARDALFEALRRVQSPWDITWDHNWVNGATNACIKTLIDAGVFKKWVESGSGPITPTRLSELTGADEVLIRRLIREISGQHLVTEVAEDTFLPTPWVHALVADPALAGCYGDFYHELQNPMFRSLPGYLKSTNFRNPSDVADCNLQFALGDPKQTLFNYIGTNALLRDSFNDAMVAHSRYNLTPWVDVYPTESVVAAAADRKDAVLVVDVGGGKGHDLEKFRAKHPAVPTAGLVLQDLPDILRGVAPGAGVTVQPHDFFTPQPVRGARLYFVHNVLHDWPDPTAVLILRNLAAAMEAGYSRLLIHESLVSSDKPLARVTVSDITMMGLLAAHERTERQWRALVASAGLRVVKIWMPPQSVESVIEVELADLN